MYFTAGVARADLFDGDELFSTSKTLIDSSIAIGVTAEDVRAGTGGKLYGKYYHSSTFDLTLSEQMFKLEYIAKNVGSDISIGGDAITNETVVLGSGGAGTVEGTPVDVNGLGTIGWAVKDKETIWEKITFTGKNFTISGASENDKYCVKYFQTNEAAKKLVISSNIVPSEITVVLTAELFNGNPDKIGEASKVGTITIKVPRFLLNGTQDIAMSMTGVSTIPMSGSALAYGGVCEDEDYYAEIVETIFDANWYDKATNLLVDDNTFELVAPATRTLKVFAIYPSGYATPKLISDNTELTFVSTDTGVATVSASGVVTPITNGTTTILVKITAKPAVEGVAYVTVSGVA
jgi:hypothetical protein